MITMFMGDQAGFQVIRFKSNQLHPSTYFCSAESGVNEDHGILILNHTGVSTTTTSQHEQF
jgi:hypothetical protein